MNSGDNFWLLFWAIAAVVISVLIISIAVYSDNKNSKLVDLIKSGSDPIAVHCSLGGQDFETCRNYVNQKYRR